MMKVHLSLLLALLSVATITACSGGGSSDDETGDGDGDGDGDDGSIPSDNSLESIEAFLAAESYKEAPWIGDAAVRESDAAWAHGNALRVYFNPLGVESSTNETDLTMGAMAVKEFYDEEGNLVGKAVNFHTGEGISRMDATFYCQAPEGSNFCTGSAFTGHPIYGVGTNECALCHGSRTFLSPLPGAD